MRICIILLHTITKLQKLQEKYFEKICIICHSIYSVYVILSDSEGSHLLRSEILQAKAFRMTRKILCNQKADEFSSAEFICVCI